VSAIQCWIQADPGDPLAYTTGLLSGRERVARVASASEQEFARLFARRPDVIIDSFAGLLTQFKPNGMSGFPLADGCSINSHVLWRDILDLEADDVAASELAVDREIEHRQVSYPALDLAFGSNRLDFFFGSAASLTHTDDVAR
jgi:hypothetical protein